MVMIMAKSVEWIIRYTESNKNCVNVCIRAGKTRVMTKERRRKKKLDEIDQDFDGQRPIGVAPGFSLLYGIELWHVYAHSYRKRVRYIAAASWLYRPLQGKRRRGWTASKRYSSNKWWDGLHTQNEQEEKATRRKKMGGIVPTPFIYVYTRSIQDLYPCAFFFFSNWASYRINFYSCIVFEETWLAAVSDGAALGVWKNYGLLLSMTALHSRFEKTTGRVCHLMFLSKPAWFWKNYRTSLSFVFFV